MTDQSVRIDPELQQLFDEIFTHWRDQDSDHVPARDLDRVLWGILADAGLTALGSAGGEEAGWLEAAALLRTAARYAAPIPLAEHDLLAGWLLGLAGHASDERPRTAAVLDSAGVAREVPWASQVDSIVVLWDAGAGPRVADVAIDGLRLEAGRDLAGSPRDTVSVDLANLDGAPAPEDTLKQFRLRGALLRAVQSVGAMERSVELAVEHATSRRQFGRPIAAFQAVQQLISEAAGETALAAAAADAAVRHAVASTELDELSTAIARSVVGHAASVVARAVHQVLGAIGTTQEHELHRHTTAMLAWQQEFGPIASWDRRLTELLLDSPGTAWELIAKEVSV